MTWRELIVELLQSTADSSAAERFAHLDQPAKVSVSEIPTVRAITAVDMMFDGRLELRTAKESLPSEE